ncbi:methylated-DNA--[protein]-cysteine S-methyltransferase, partial [Akkermansiaceae bacterium]|nr:methylated-DNA--[protein]-cysteine S-methyltransferase [Akkermansiaceae bacterium]
YFGHRIERSTLPDKGRKCPFLDQAEKELGEYFEGKRTSFKVSLDAKGSEFQRSAWKELQAIPFGETISYGEQARRMGDVKAVRAVGTANGANPVSIIIPCHRVIGKSGDLTGFGGGVDIKRKLLALEGHGFDLD